MLKMKCNSCGKNIGYKMHYSSFLCPKCGKSKIIRCGECKIRAVIYICDKCGFSGPC